MVFTLAPGFQASALILDDLPEVGKPFACGPYTCKRILSVDPFPYKCPQDDCPENYQYAVWQITYEPVNSLKDETFFAAIHEPESDTM